MPEKFVSLSKKFKCSRCIHRKNFSYEIITNKIIAN